MINIVATDEHGNILAHVTIERIGPRLDDERYADYSVRVGVELGGGEVSIHQRAVRAFPRRQLNVLALIKAALEPLGQEQLELHPNANLGSPDLARRQRRSDQEVPREASRALRHYRPAFWRRQSE